MSETSRKWAGWAILWAAAMLFGVMFADAEGWERALAFGHTVAWYAVGATFAWRFP